MLEPVWRGGSAMFVSLTPGSNPRPPTIARTAPVLVSSDTIAASKPCAVSGQDVAGVLGQRLQVGVERRVDAQAAAVQGGVALLVRPAEDVGAVEQVVAERLGVVGAGVLALRRRPDPLGQDERARDVVRADLGVGLGLGDVAVLDEAVEDLAEAGPRALRLGDRVVARRRAHQPGEEGGLDERELVDGLGEVGLGRGLRRRRRCCRRRRC